MIRGECLKVISTTIANGGGGGGGVDNYHTDFMTKSEWEGSPVVLWFFCYASWML